MKSRITMSLGVCLLAMFTFTQCKRDHTSDDRKVPTQKKANAALEAPVPSLSPPTPVKQPANAQQSSVPQPMKAVINNRFGKDAVEAKTAMEATLANWNPVGRSVDELRAAFGKPDAETKDSLTYRFDTGYGGWDFEFKIRSKKVSELVRKSVD